MNKISRTVGIEPSKNQRTNTQGAGRVNRTRACVDPQWYSQASKQMERHGFIEESDARRSMRVLRRSLPLLRGRPPVRLLRRHRMLTAHALSGGSESCRRNLVPSRGGAPPIIALAGKCYYQLEDYKSAIESFEKAVGAEPENAGYHNWLGKAYGRRRKTRVFITAPRLAARSARCVPESRRPGSPQPGGRRGSLRILP